MCYRLLPRPPLPGQRVRVPRKESLTRLPPGGDGCVGCLACFLFPTAPCQKEVWGKGRTQGLALVRDPTLGLSVVSLLANSQLSS